MVASTLVIAIGLGVVIGGVVLVFNVVGVRDVVVVVVSTTK